MTLFPRLTAGATASVLAIGFALPAAAQQAGIQIAVVADDGRPLADIDVLVENPGIGLRRVVRSDAQGLARIEGLTTAGEYRVSALANERFESGEPRAFRCVPIFRAA